jgi:hypothetical protein
MSALPQIGTIAGWRIDLGTTPPRQTAIRNPRNEISFASDDYRGTVEASLVNGLDPGRYHVIVESVTDEQYGKLVALAKGTAPLIARLYMYWNDARSPLDLTGDDGLVAVFRVTSLRRRAGTWRYELVIDGRDWVYDRLLTVVSPISESSGLKAAESIVTSCMVDSDPPYTPSTEEENVDAVRSSQQSEPAKDALARLADVMAAEAMLKGKSRGGLGMYVIRDGKLLIGPDRLDKIVKPTKIDATTGLLLAERAGSLSERDASEISDDDDTSGPRRDVFSLTLRGRADLKPGHVIEFEAPEAGALGEDLGFALGGPPVSRPGSTAICYIQEVNHRITREIGFLTSVQCVGAAPGEGKSLADRLWFKTFVADRASEASAPETRLANTLRKARMTRPLRWPDVAQVRAHYVSGSTPPAQTEKLRRGLKGPDDKAFAAARAAFTKHPEQVTSAPYATPFAWGKFGLIVPRYPGTRVLLVHRNGDPDDPVDIGALWDRGGAPEAHAGDWWLSLPAQIAEADRSSVDDKKDPAVPSGKASNDLIDADGTRVITIGKLTIKAGDDALLDAGKRPEASDPPISIEHTNGAKITIDQNGAITIYAKDTLTLQAENDIVLDTPGKVAMKVGDKVDITQRTP